MQLTRTQRDLGAATGLDVAQAEDLLYTARATLRDIERQIAQTEDLLSFLLGENPGDIIRGRTLDETAQNASVPPAAPACLRRCSSVARRPGRRGKSRRRQRPIGAAKAQYFPQISLTGLLGVQSDTFKEFFKKSSLVYNLGGTAAVPIFTAGRISSQVDLAEGQTQEALAAYQKSRPHRDHRSLRQPDRLRQAARAA